MSGINKKIIIPYGLLFIGAFVIGYLGIHHFRLKEQLSALQESLNSSSDEDALNAALANGDSLFLANDYDEAMAIYQSILDENDADVRLRSAATERIIDLLGEKQRLSKRLAFSSRDTTIQGVKESTYYSWVDSLSFALEKSQVQLKSLKQQLKTKSYGQYITFKSLKGNRLHYVGQVKGGKANGYGIAILDSGSRYEGQWKDNKRHGQGKYYWIDGERYEGAYVDDRRSGLGTYYWANGEYFTGQWKDDMRNGEGTFYSADGEVLASGVWQDDELVEASKS